jgi:hypothetical protein
LSTQTQPAPHINADYIEAQRYERSQDWKAACSTYLRLIFDQSPESTYANEALERITQESATVFARVCWGVALACQGLWRRSEDALSPLPDRPLNLSPKILDRWPAFKERTQDGLFPPWITLLRLIDRVLSLGYPAEALMMSQYALTYISDGRERALIYFEAGRLGILHHQVALGVGSMRSALSFEPSLRPQARQLVDQALIDQRVDGDDLEDLFLLRLNHVEDLEEWAYEIIESAPDHQRVNLANQLGVCAAHQVERFVPAYIFYQIAVEQIITSADLKSIVLQNLTHLILSGHLLTPEEMTHQQVTSAEITSYEQSFIKLLKSQRLYEDLERYLRDKAKLPLPAIMRVEALSACAHFASHLRGDFRTACELLFEAMTIDPQAVDLRGVIRAAREIENWEALDQLLSMQLHHTNSVKKKQALLRAQAQSRLTRGLHVPAYLALVGVLSLGSSSETEAELNQLLEESRAAQDIEAWLLRDEVEYENTGWTQEILAYRRHLSRHEAEGGAHDAVSFLTKALHRAPLSWEVAQALLEELDARDRMEDWVHQVLTANTTRWPIETRVPMIDRAIEYCRRTRSTFLPATLRKKAQWIADNYAAPEELFQLWRAYLEVAPSDRQALETFDPIARALGEWDELARRYEEALPLRTTGKLHLLELLAELYEHQIGDDERAERCWWAVLNLKPYHDRAGAKLALLLCQREAWREVHQLCQRWDPSPADLSTHMESQLRADLALKDLYASMLTWEHLEDRSTRQLFLPSLLELAEEVGDGPIVLKLLEEDLSYEGKWSKHLESAHHGMIDDSVDDLPPPLPLEDSLYDHEDSTAPNIDLEGLQGRHLERLKLKAKAITYLSPNPDALWAVTAWRAVRELHRYDPDALLALAELYASMGMREYLVEVIDDASEHLDRGDHYRRVVTFGALKLESRFEDAQEAFLNWLKIYEHVPMWRPQALTAIERVARRGGLWRYLKEFWFKLYEITDSQSIRYEAQLAQAQLYASHLNDWSRAYDCLIELERLRPRDPEIKALLNAITAPLGAWELATDYWRRWADQVLIGPVRSSWLIQTAEVYETRLERPEDARHLYQAALEIEGSGALVDHIHRLNERLSYGTTPD